MLMIPYFTEAPGVSSLRIRSFLCEEELARLLSVLLTVEVIATNNLTDATVNSNPDNCSTKKSLFSTDYIVLF